MNTWGTVLRPPDRFCMACFNPKPSLHVNVGIGQSLCIKQGKGTAAKGAPAGGVNFDLGHANHLAVVPILGSATSRCCSGRVPLRLGSKGWRSKQSHHQASLGGCREPGQGLEPATSDGLPAIAIQRGEHARPRHDPCRDPAQEPVWNPSPQTATWRMAGRGRWSPPQRCRGDPAPLRW